MRRLGIGVALATMGGCLLQVTQGTNESTYRGTAAGTSSGGSSPAMTAGGATSVGSSIGGGSGGGGSGVGTSSGGGATGAGTTTGGCEDSGCPAGMICASGACACPNGQTFCTDTSTVTGIFEGCFDTSSDPFNCGSCDFTCSGGGECSDGGCTCAPGIGQTPCPSPTGMVCTDELTDPSNCGGCGQVCSAPSPDCIGGICSCLDGATLCGGADSGVAPTCVDPLQDPANCGSCGDDCATDYAAGSECVLGLCVCPVSQYQLCPNLPETSPPSCDCIPVTASCSPPSFAADVYPLLAQQNGAFGCAASGCHSGGAPAGGLAFLDPLGDLDAGMAYAELLGIDGGSDAGGSPYCDGGVAGAASTQCACVSRVVPGNVNVSFLIDTLSNDLPAQCAYTNPMPIDGAGEWSPLTACSLELVEQWISTGANP